MSDARTGLPDPPASNADAGLGDDYLRETHDVLKALIPVIGRGTLLARPAAGDPNRFYLVPPVEGARGQLYADAVSEWLRIQVGLVLAEDLAAAAVTAAKLGAITINPQTGASYSLANGDYMSVVTIDRTTASDLVLPSDATAPGLPIGSVVQMLQLGNGAFTCTEGAGATRKSLNSKFTSNGNGAAVSAFKYAANAWHVSGDLV